MRLEDIVFVVVDEHQAVPIFQQSGIRRDEKATVLFIVRAAIFRSWLLDDVDQVFRTLGSVSNKVSSGMYTETNLHLVMADSRTTVCLIVNTTGPRDMVVVGGIVAGRLPISTAALLSEKGTTCCREGAGSVLICIVKPISVIDGGIRGKTSA